MTGAAATAGAVASGTTPVADADAASAERAKASEFVGWLAIAGTALALVGFLLPWSSISVIGADGVATSIDGASPARGTSSS